MGNSLLFCIIFAVAFCSYPTKTFSQDILVRNYLPDAGLPSSEVYDVHQDRLGYIWFATDRGVSRYNGYTFEVFTTEDGLGDNVAFSIYEDTRGVLWFSTFSKGLYCYTPDSGFYPSALNTEILKITANVSWVDNMAFDDGQIWISLKNEHVNGAIYYSIDGVCLKKHAVPQAIGNVNTIRQVGKQGVVFESLQFVKKTDANPLTPLLFDGNGNYGLSTQRWGLRKCLRTGNETMFCVTADELFRIYKNKITGTYRFDNEVLNVCGGPDSIFVTTRNGAYLFDVQKNINPIGYFLKGVSITNIIQDNEGNYWFTTLDKGVFMAPSLDFRIYSDITEKILDVVASGDVMFGITTSKKVFIINRQHQVKYTVASNKTVGVHNLFSNRLKPLLNEYFIDSNNTLHKNKVLSRAKCILPHSGYWVFAGIGGFHIFKNNRRYYMSDEHGFTIRVNAICGNDSIVWLGTLHGLYNYRFSDDAITPYTAIPQRINALTFFGNTIIVGTAGAGVYIVKGNQTINIKETEGLAGNYVSSFFLRDEMLFVGTNKGFSAINLQKNGEVADVQSYTKNNGLPSNEINGFCFFNNLLWVYTNGGLVYIDPTKLKRKIIKEMPVYITGIRVNDTLSVIPKKLLQFAYNERNISIDYTNIAFANPAGTYYYYKLDGLHKGWLKTTEKSVKFINLPPGDYVFHVSATNVATGISPQKISSVSIHIDKYFTQTWWFISLCLSAVAGVVFFGVRLYVKSHQRKLSFQRKLILSEQQALRAQMNPHFIFNALNSVQYYITENDKRSAGIFLAKFSSLIRTILDNSKHSVISLEEELACIKKYLELEQVRFGNKFSFTVSVDPSISLSSVKIPSMLIQPFLENAIWHGLMPKNEPGTLLFSVKQNNGNIECVIEDDGIGRKKAGQIERSKAEYKSTAIENIEKRLQLIKQLLGVYIHLIIEDKYSESGEAAGTKVFLTFQPRLS